VWLATAPPAFFITTITTARSPDVAVVAGAAFNDDGREQAGMGSTVATMTATADAIFSKTNFFRRYLHGFTGTMATAR